MFAFKIHLGLLKSFEGLEDIATKVAEEGLEVAYKKYVLEDVLLAIFKCRFG